VVRLHFLWRYHHVFSGTQIVVGRLRGAGGHLVVGREGTITVTVRPTPKDAKDAEALAIPLVLTGTAEELDAQFVGLLRSYAEEHQSLAEQLEATRNILEAAKKDASKKAEGAIRKALRPR
jgi:PRTRC genetic system protein E